MVDVSAGFNAAVTADSPASQAALNFIHSATERSTVAKTYLGMPNTLITDFDKGIRSLQGHAASQLTAIASLAHLCLQELESMPDAENATRCTFCNTSLAQGSFKGFFGYLHKAILVRNCVITMHYISYCDNTCLLLQLALFQAPNF